MNTRNLIASAIVAIALAWAFRFQVVTPSGSANSSSMAYLVNRWTGTIYIISGGQYWQVTPLAMASTAQ